MKKIFNLILLTAFAALIGACSKENPFEDGQEVLKGKFDPAALVVKIQNEMGVPDVYNRPTKAGAPNIENFLVEFIKKGEVNPTESYRYSEMPEIVVLPVGDYEVKASYGENLPAAWENPYYTGSTEITIKANEIVEEADPIICSLANVRVSVVFDQSLKENMGSDSKVTVYMGEGNSGKLDFTVEDSEKSGYFAYLKESNTLAAVFSGTVEGYPSSETKAYNDVAPGRHYRITFRLHQAGAEDPGEINSTLNVDASVEIVDMNRDITFEDDVIEDDMRPKEEDPTPTPGPGPDIPVVSAPALTAKAPLTLDGVNNVDSSSECVLYIHSETGIEEFKVTIISDDLTADELAGFGLSKDLDLVNTPDEMTGGLTGLGFPVRVGGEKDLEFNLTTFMPMMAVFGAHRHSFHFVISDSNGTTEKDLILQF